MATLTQANAAGFKKATIDLSNPGLLSQATDLDYDRQDLDKALRIAGVLQTSLDLRKVISTFVSEVGRILSLHGVSYEFSEQGIQHVVGDLEKHSLTYRLAVADQSLGEITFTRKRRFTTKESTVLEHLLCGLVYPLRNALAYENAVQAALRDPLTGAHNRTAMDAAMAREVELARRHGYPLSLIAIDIDHFKIINDEHGHAAGDCVLRGVVDSITSTVRGSDMVFRYGGEEFIVLLSNTARQGAIHLAERIRRGVESTPVMCQDGEIQATVSLGVAWFGDNDTGQRLLQRADEALYAAKHAGRNLVRF